MTALIIEDDPEIAATEIEFVTSLGHAHLHAATLEDARRLIDADGYDYVLLDLQIPIKPGAKAIVTCGETALTLLRERHPRRNARGFHVVPILVVTSYSQAPDFVSRMHINGADDYIAKPFGDRVELILDRIRAALDRAGPREVKPAAAPPPPAEEAPVVRIAIDGTWADKNTTVIVDDKRCAMQDRVCGVFLRLVLAHQREPGTKSSRKALGVGSNPNLPSRIRTTLRDALPKDFDLVPASRSGAYWLNPAVVIERVNWAALATHPDDAIAELAKAQLKPARR